MLSFDEHWAGALFSDFQTLWAFVARLLWAHPAHFCVVERLGPFSSLYITWFLFRHVSPVAYLPGTVVPCSFMSPYRHSFRPVVKAALITAYCLRLCSSVGYFSIVNRAPGKKLCLQKLADLLIQCHGDVEMLQAQRLVTLAWASSSLLEPPFLDHLCAGTNILFQID